MKKLLLLAPLLIAAAPPRTVPSASGAPVPVTVTAVVDGNGDQITSFGGASGSYNGPLAAQLPASLGSKTGANSLTVVPATDGVFASSAALGSYVAGSIVDIGTGASPAANTVNARLATINTTLGSPYQAGGTLPLPTGAATSALQTTINTSVQAVTTKQAATGASAQTVQGSDVVGAAPAGNPIGNAVFDGTNTQRMRGDTVGTYVVSTPTAAAVNAITPASTATSAFSYIIKTSGGNLYGLNVTTGATAGYLMIFNAVAVPANGTVTPTRCYAIAANTTIELNYRAMPIAFSTGISATLSAGADCFTKATPANGAFYSADAK